MQSASLSRVYLTLGLVLIVLPAVAFAHPGHDGGHGLEWDFAGGFTHPLFGLDHLLAMLAVGVWSAQVGGRARWLVPATFVGVMALGAVLGNQTASLSAVEPMIAASLLAFGLMVVLAKRLPLTAGLALTALFAVFHGFAHGAELPIASNGFSYGLGFVGATILLHGIGFALGQVTARQPAWFARTASAGVATVGAVMLVA